MSAFRASLLLIREGLGLAHSITVHANTFAPVSRAVFQAFSVHASVRVAHHAQLGMSVGCIFVRLTGHSTGPKEGRQEESKKALPKAS